MPIAAATAVPPQVSMALQALSSSLQAEEAVSSALLGGATAGATNPGLGQIVDLSA